MSRAASLAAVLFAGAAPAALLIAGAAPARALPLEVPTTVAASDFSFAFSGPLATPQTVGGIGFDVSTPIATLFGQPGTPDTVCGFIGGAGCQAGLSLTLPAPSRAVSITLSGPTPAEVRAFDGAELTAVRTTALGQTLSFDGGFNIDRLEVTPLVSGPGNSVAFAEATFTPSTRDERTFIDMSLASSDTPPDGETIRGVTFGWFLGFVADKFAGPPSLCAFAPGAGCLGAVTADLPEPADQVSYSVTGLSPTLHEAFDAQGGLLGTRSLGAGGGAVDFSGLSGVASLRASPSAVNFGEGFEIAELAFRRLPPAQPPSGTDVPLPGAAGLLLAGAGALLRIGARRRA